MNRTKRGIKSFPHYYYNGSKWKICYMRTVKHHPRLITEKKNANNITTRKLFPRFVVFI